VTNPTDAEDGRPSSSLSHVPAMSSNAIDAGDDASLKASWSHPVVSTSATRGASNEPPVTNPK
jgi:hypothetical protein